MTSHNLIAESQNQPVVPTVSAIAASAPGPTLVATPLSTPAKAGSNRPPDCVRADDDEVDSLFGPLPDGWRAGLGRPPQTSPVPPSPAVIPPPPYDFKTSEDREEKVPLVPLQPDQQRSLDSVLGLTAFKKATEDLDAFYALHPALRGAEPFNLPSRCDEKFGIAWSSEVLNQYNRLSVNDSLSLVRQWKEVFEGVQTQARALKDDSSRYAASAISSVAKLAILEQNNKNVLAKKKENVVAVLKG